MSQKKLKVKMEYKKLAEMAVEAKSSSHPPYSNFHVGAALLTDKEKVIIGGNIETSSYSLTICAERVAVFKAFSEGERKFKAIAIASDAPGFCPPCGACRQVMLDLCGDIDIVMVNNKDEIKVLKLSQMLPYPFGDNELQ